MAYLRRCRLINILRGANQPVPEELMKFGTTVKKKAHDTYGAFFKDVMEYIEAVILFVLIVTLRCNFVI
ncbi:hypothetical protein VTK73DRAFT_6484 [Phialemonium thermophilum]|uniref:Uncharacterized protein n=1 Tax=Phialemonium thermophilum TaxID=223376 RepID=A0ABR3UZD4_9PEZI